MYVYGVTKPFSLRWHCWTSKKGKQKNVGCLFLTQGQNHLYPYKYNEPAVGSLLLPTLILFYFLSSL